MLALAGYPLGLSFRFLDPSPEACAGQVGELVVGEFLDEGALLRFAEGLALVPRLAPDRLESEGDVAEKRRRPGVARQPLRRQRRFRFASS